jgi:hypothetical protein
MLQRTNKLLIGKDISRDAQVVDGAIITTTVASTGLADGESLFLTRILKYWQPVLLLLIPILYIFVKVQAKPTPT